MGVAKESQFQKKLIKKLKDIFPGCVILKNDARYKDNIPDLTILWKNHYALLEVKRDEASYEKSLKDISRRNQEYYINKFNEWSYASFVYPENVDQVLSELKEAFS